MDNLDIISGMAMVAAGLALSLYSRRIAGAVARLRSRLLTFRHESLATVGPEYYRIPLMLAGIVLATVGILIAANVINLR